MMRMGLKRGSGFTVSVAVTDVLLKLAVIPDEVADATARDVAVKVADVAVPGIAMLAGTVAAAGLLLDKVTTAPLDGGNPLRVTVPVELVPPTTLVGLSVSDATPVAAGFTVNVACAEPLKVAVMIEALAELTA